MKWATLALLAVVLASFPAWAAVTTVEVTAEGGANLRSEPSTKASVVAKLKTGTVLTVEETRGEWFRVEAPGGEKGWIHQSVVGKPSPGSEGQTGSWRGTGQAVRRGFMAERTSKAVAAAGARGLDENGGGGGGRADPDAVRRMESWTPGRDEVRAFIREGGLSPERMP